MLSVCGISKVSSGVSVSISEVSSIAVRSSDDELLACMAQSSLVCRDGEEGEEGEEIGAGGEWGGGEWGGGEEGEGGGEEGGVESDSTMWCSEWSEVW